MEIHNECHRYQECVRHQDELREVLEKLIGAVRALVLLFVNRWMHLGSANEFDRQVQMLTVVRRFAVMRRTVLVSSAWNVIALSEWIVIILILLIRDISVEFLC